MNRSPVTAIVRAWVDLYTRGMPADLRAARRDEIDDDLWCQAEESLASSRSARGLAAEQLFRLALGMPADLSWRMAYRGPVATAHLERSSSMHSRAIGGSAMVAALCYAFLLVLFVPMGHALWTGGIGAPVVLITLVGVFAFIGAGLGLAWEVQDRIGPLGGLGAMVLMVGALVNLGAGPVVPLVAGSAMLMWDLARIGVVSRLVAVVHAASAIAFTAGQLLGQPVMEEVGGRVVLLAMFAPFLLSWFALGMSLSRGAPSAEATAT